MPREHWGYQLRSRSSVFGVGCGANKVQVRAIAQMVGHHVLVHLLGSQLLWCVQSSKMYIEILGNNP